ncbi:ABC transporter permease [bacterium]|jgi:ABC-type dipeptide/oligopeptide/nickel transport system permease subunit|nr:ABC transporter permease [bacterium]
MAELAQEQLSFPVQRQNRTVAWVISFARRKPLSAIAAVILIAACALALLAPVVTTHNPNIGNLGEHLQSPSMSHILGTDEQGRDEWTRIVYGARTSLAVGLGAAFVGTVIGSLFGLISGYVGGVLDMVIQRVMDAIMALPAIILLMVLATVLSPSLRNVTLAIAIFIIPSAARVVHGAVLSTKAQVYVEAARSVGATPGRVMLRHILPNVMAPIIIVMSITVGAAIIIEAALGFLGLSVAPPTATWGNMLNAGASSAMESAPWLALAPGIAIGVTVFSVNILGDGLRDVLDPRLRGKGH